MNPSAAAFFIFCCILIVVGLTSQGLGVAVSAGSPNERVAMALAPALTIVLILFGGFYVNEGAHREGAGMGGHGSGGGQKCSLALASSLRERNFN